MTVTGPRTATLSAEAPLPLRGPRAALAARGAAPAQAWSRRHLNSRLFPHPGDAARRSAARRAVSPRLPAHGAARADSGSPRDDARKNRTKKEAPPPSASPASSGTKREQQIQLQRPSESGQRKQDVRAPRQRDGTSGPEAAGSPQRPLWAGGRTAPAAPRGARPWLGFPCSA